MTGPGWLSPGHNPVRTTDFTETGERGQAKKSVYRPFSPPDPAVFGGKGSIFIITACICFI